MLTGHRHRLRPQHSLPMHALLWRVPFGWACRLHDLRLKLRGMLVGYGATIKVLHRLVTWRSGANDVGSIESTRCGRCGNFGRAMVERRQLHRVGNRRLLVLHLQGSWPHVRQPDHIEF